jgi:hypothetical protein
MKTELIVDIENLFIELTRNWFIKDYASGLESLQRTGIFTGAMTMWLMISQKCLSRDTLASVLQILQRGDPKRGVMSWNSKSKRIGSRKISNSAGGLCQARQRLPLEKVEEITDLIYEKLCEEHLESGQWQGRRVYLIDGSTIALPNSQQIRESYPSTSNQQELFPEMRIVVAHDLITGVAVRPSHGTIHESEQELACAIMKRLEKGSVLIGDRNFGVFSVAYGAQEAGHQVLFRLTKERATRMAGKQLSSNSEQVIEWAPSIYDRKTTPSIPKDAVIRGRVFTRQQYAPGYRTETIYFFTTTFDASADELFVLYGKRWCIELDIRTIKQTIGLEMFTAKSPDVVKKELLLSIVAYNLVRSVIARGAACLGICPREISFVRAAEFCVTAAHWLLHCKTAAERHAVFDRFLVGLKQLRHPHRRKTRIEPRKIARRKTTFPFLGQNREQERMKIFKNMGA